jgi:hypothetical protein
MNQPEIVTHSMWLGITEPEFADVQVGDDRYVFIDGFGLLEGKVLDFSEEEVTVQIDEWDNPYTFDYSVLGIRLNEEWRVAGDDIAE